MLSIIKFVATYGPWSYTKKWTVNRETEPGTNIVRKR